MSKPNETKQTQHADQPKEGKAYTEAMKLSKKLADTTFQDDLDKAKKDAAKINHPITRAIAEGLIAVIEGKSPSIGLMRASPGGKVFATGGVLSGLTGRSKHDHANFKDTDENSFSVRNGYAKPAPTITIVLDAEKVKRLSHGLSDIACWVNGFKAGNPDSSYSLLGLEEVRELNRALKSALEDHDSKSRREDDALVKDRQYLIYECARLSGILEAQESEAEAKVKATPVEPPKSKPKAKSTRRVK